MALKKTEVAQEVRDALKVFRDGVLDGFIRRGIRTGRFWRDVSIALVDREVILVTKDKRYTLEVKIRQGGK